MPSPVFFLYPDASKRASLLYCLNQFFFNILRLLR